MRVKMYTMRSLAVDNGKDSHLDLHLEFEGKRAFVIWDSVTLGNYQLQARVEIDPKRLRKARQPGCDFVYRGKLVLPRPQDN